MAKLGLTVPTVPDLFPNGLWFVEPADEADLEVIFSIPGIRAMGQYLTFAAEAIVFNPKNTISLSMKQGH